MAQRNRSFSRSRLSLMNPDAAGVDIGSAAHFFAVPVDRDDEQVREFASLTVDLNALADWLAQCGIKTVATASTGVHWIPLYELLRGAVRPDDKVCELRSITRQWAMLHKRQGRHVQHMQKALTQMNIQLANVISEVAVATGQKIIREIVADLTSVWPGSPNATPRPNG